MVELPVANWPKEDGLHKVVQLELNGDLYLRFGESDFSRLYHAAILMETLILLDIHPEMLTRDTHPDGMVPMGEQRRVYKIPSPLGADYRASGMGYAEIDLANKCATFSRRSGDYDIPIDFNHLLNIAPHLDGWKLEAKRHDGK